MRHALKSALLLFAAIGSAAVALADEPSSAIPADLILERFAVNKGGDCLLVPVKIAGKERLFLVDTGCTRIIVDKDIPLGEPRESVTMQTSQGEIILKSYAAPEGSVGQLPLRVDSVLGMDLNKFREASGYPIAGILGIDFLARYAIHIDFDRGELLILKQAPESAGDVLPIDPNDEDLPELDAWLSPDQKVRFIVDTGYISHDAGAMESHALRPLVKEGDFQEVGSTLVESASGTHTRAVLQGKRIALGGFSVDRPIFSESPSKNLIGLGFWSRFVVTFDFPHQMIYLRKGKSYERPDLRDLSGLHLLRRDGATVLHSVDKDSPASRAGFQAGDVLLTLGTSPADDTTLFEMQKALARSGPLACTVRRGAEELRLTLSLPR